MVRGLESLIFCAAGGHPIFEPMNYSNPPSDDVQVLWKQVVAFARYPPWLLRSSEDGIKNRAATTRVTSSFSLACDVQLQISRRLVCAL